MSITFFSKQFQLSNKQIDESGVFDQMIGRDSHLYFDPACLFEGDSFIGIDSFCETITSKFKNIVKFINLRRVSPEDESAVYSKVLWKYLYFKEVKGTSLGFASKTNNGRALTKQAVKQTIKNLTDIDIAGGLCKEEIMLLELFCVGIGCDEISDLIVYLAQDPIYAYNEAKIKELGLSTQLMIDVFSPFHPGKVYHLLKSPYKKEPIVLLPKKILSDLPKFSSFDDIDNIIRVNERARKLLEGYFDWDTIRKQKNTASKKGLMLDAFINKEGFGKSIIDEYKELGPNLYDFNEDKNGLFLRNTLSKLAQESPELIKPLCPLPSNSYECALATCERLKQLIERNGLWRTLKDRDEFWFQSLFLAVSSVLGDISGISIDPETNNGNGPVDFCLSKGSHDICLVETKRLSNPGYCNSIKEHGQLNDYMDSKPNCQKGIYLVFGDSNDSKTRYQKLQDTYLNLPQIWKEKVVLFFVDICARPSASKNVVVKNS